MLPAAAVESCTSSLPYSGPPAPERTLQSTSAWHSLPRLLLQHHRHAVKQAADEEEQEAKDARKEERQAKRAKRDDEEREKNEKIRRITAAIDRTIEWAERDRSGPDDWNMIKMQKPGRLQSA